MKFTHTGAEPVVVFGFSAVPVDPGQTIEFAAGPEFPGLLDRLTHSATFAPADDAAAQAVAAARAADAAGDETNTPAAPAAEEPVTPQRAPGGASLQSAPPEVAAVGGADSEDNDPE